MKRVFSKLLVALALAILWVSTYCFTSSIYAYAEEVNSFVVGINHSSGGVIEIIQDGVSKSVKRGDTITVQQGDNLVIRAIPDAYFGVTSIKLNNAEIAPNTAFSINGINKDYSVYVEFRLTDIDKLLDYGSYVLTSEYSNMAMLAENQIMRAVCSYSDKDVNGMVGREIFKNAFDIAWQTLSSLVTGNPNYEEEQIDKLTDAFIENYYNELVKDDNFTQAINLSDYAIPFEKTFKEVKSWSEITGDELLVLRGEWIYESSKLFDSKPIEYADALLQSKKELGPLIEKWDNYMDFFDSVYSFQEFVIQMIMLRDIDRGLIEDLYNATDDSTVLHIGLKRRLDRIDKSNLTLCVEYAINQHLVKKLGDMTQDFTFGLMGTYGNAIGLVYAAISSGIQIYEKVYDVASLADYVIACYACDAQMYFYQEIGEFVDNRNTDARKLELLIRAHSAAARTAVSKGENAITKLYNGTDTSEEKTKQKENIEYKFAIYKSWVESSACSYTAFIGQWIEYAEACENGAPLTYTPESLFIDSYKVTKNARIDKHSFTIDDNPKVDFYSNIGLFFRLEDDATLTVDNYVNDVKISSIGLNSHTLNVYGNVILKNMYIGTGTLSFFDEPIIDGIVKTSSADLVFNDGLTIDGGLYLEGGSVVVNGDLKHINGELRPENIVINGNYYGYIEDSDGNKLPGGSINMLSDTSDLKITGDCYLYNSAYSGASYLAHGKLELQGDLINLSEEYASTSANLFLTGDHVQKILSPNNGTFVLWNVNVTSPGLDVSELDHIQLELCSDATFFGSKISGYVFGKEGSKTYPKLKLANSMELHGRFNGISGLTSDGNLLVDANVVFQNDGCMTINGDLTHNFGSIEVENGTINGNYYAYNVDELGNKYEGGNLHISSGDYLKITGDCYIYSGYYSAHYSNSNITYDRLYGGTLELEGNLINLANQKVGSSLYLILSGDDVQKIISTNDGSFDLLSVKVQSPGVDISNAGNIDIGVIDGATIYADKINGSVCVKSSSNGDPSVTFVKPVEINGDIVGYSDLTINGSLYLNGNMKTGRNGTLTLNGDLNHVGGAIEVGGGVINGNYNGYTEDEYGNILPGGYIKIDSDSEYLKITGDCYLYNSGYSDSSYLASGTLELKGDLINLGGDQVGMSLSLTFSGDDVQRIISTNDGGFDLGCVVAGSSGLDVSNAGYISMKVKEDTAFCGTKITGSISGIGVEYWDPRPKVSFADSMELNCNISNVSGLISNGDLYLNGDVSFFYGGVLSINGDLTHAGGKIESAIGTINGNYYGYSEDSEGNKSQGGYLSIYSNWFVEDSLVRLKITGDCYLYNSSYSEIYSSSVYKNLRSGTLEIQGDLINLGDGPVGCTSNLVFSGDKVQKIISANGGSFDLQNVTVTSLGVDLSDSATTITLDSVKYYIIRNSDDAIEFVAPISLYYTSSVVGHSILLTDGIGVKFFMNLSENIVDDENAVMKFTVNGKDTVVPVKDSQPEILSGQTVYSFTCNVAAAEMADVISAQIVLGAYDSEVFTYSVQTYSKYILDNSDEYSEYIPVVNAMLNYGAEAQKYFDHNTENLANSILEEDDKVILSVISDQLSPYKYAITDSDANIDFLGYVISLQNRITAKLYFADKNGKSLTTDDFTVVVDDNVIDFSRLSIGNDSNGMYLAISDIMAGDFDQGFTVTIGGITIEDISVYSFLQQCLDENRLELAGLIDSLYSFNEAVEIMAA